MKRLFLATAVAALMLSPAAFAKDHGNGHGGGWGHDHQTFAVEHGSYDRDRHDGERNDDRNDDRRYDDRRANHDRRESWREQGRHDNGRHLGQAKHAWGRGERISRTYLEPRYYVNDYGNYQLAPPPQGMVWVRPYQDDRRFYLVQMATGLISQILGR